MTYIFRDNYCKLDVDSDSLESTLLSLICQMEDQTFITALRNSKPFLIVKLLGTSMLQEAQVSQHGLAGICLKDSKFLVFNWVTCVHAVTENNTSTQFYPHFADVSMRGTIWVEIQPNYDTLQVLIKSRYLFFHS